VYVLLDADTLAPVAVLDGAALTTLRTPAVSVAAVRSVLPASRPVRVVVFGAGPQAVGHLFTLAAVLEADGPRPADAPLSLLDVDMVVRAPAAAAVPATSGATVRVLRAGSPAARRALEDAQLVVCATTSHEPLFPAQDLRPDAVVVAVGAHDPTALEVEPALAGRARVVVEDPATALREAGVVRAAVGAGLLGPEALVPMAHVVTTASAPVEGPVLFVSVGMAWEDLVVASAVHDKALGQGPG
jgi:ornithine cyclodeaminase